MDHRPLSFERTARPRPRTRFDSRRLHIPLAGDTVVRLMYRYRLLSEATGADLGPLVSARLTFGVGETISRGNGECFRVLRIVEPENENFRAYLIVRAEDG